MGLVRNSDEGGPENAPLDRDGVALDDFPPAVPTRGRFVLPGAARRRGLDLRPATRADLPFLRSLFGELRRPELEAAGWPAALQQAFCDRQFALQHDSFTRHFHHADFLVVLSPAAPIGRLYVDRTGPVFHIVEIALVASQRGRGLGGFLIDAVKAAARRASAEAVTLQVHPQNHAARRFYARAGFVEAGEEASHTVMRWNR